MRSDLEGATRIDDGKCACPRYQIKTSNALGAPQKGTVALHSDACKAAKEVKKRVRHRS